MTNDEPYKSMNDVYSEGLHSVGKRDQTICTNGFSLLNPQGKKSTRILPHHSQGNHLWYPKNVLIFQSQKQ